MQKFNIYEGKYSYKLMQKLVLIEIKSHILSLLICLQLQWKHFKKVNFYDRVYLCTYSAKIFSFLFLHKICVKKGHVCNERLC